MFLFISRYALDKILLCLNEAAFDCVFVHVERIGDLLGGHSVIIVKNERRSFFVVELVNQLHYFLAKLLLLDSRTGLVVLVLIDKGINDKIFLLLILEKERIVFAKYIPRLVCNNHIKPAHKSLGILNILRFVDQVNIGFLQNILGVTFVFTKLERREIHPFIGAVVNLFKHRAVAVFQFNDEFGKSFVINVHCNLPLSRAQHPLPHDVP